MVNEFLTLKHAYRLRKRFHSLTETVIIGVLGKR